MNATEREVCPACGATTIESKANSYGGQERVHDTAYYCKDCQTHFDDPDTDDRERRPPSVGLAAELYERGVGGDA